MGIAERQTTCTKRGYDCPLATGLPVEQIAMALQVDVELAKQWIGDK